MRAVATILASALLATAQETAHKRALAELSERQLKANLTFLTSESLAGRLSLERGSDVASAWVASEFAKAGLRGPAPGYLQPVPLIEYRIDRENTSVTIGTRSYHAPQATVAFPKAGTIQGEIVFTGFGITAPELHYDDYAGLDVKGKIVLIFDHEPQESDPKSIFSGKGNTRYAGTFVKVRIAQEHGAVAVLMIPEPIRKHPSVEERRNRVSGANQRARIPSQALEDDELKIPLVSLAESIGDELLAAAGHPARELHASIDRDLKPVSMALPNAAASIKIAIASTREATGYNAVGLLEGSDPKLKNETVIISAHSDHDGPAGDGGVYFPGADDNGSGTVGVVALAHAFTKSGVRPKRSILFVVFAAEERGLLGSYYYVAHPLRPLEGTRAVINFDMIGRDEKPSTQTDGLIQIADDTTNEMNLVGTYYSPDYTAAVERANKKVGLQLNYKWDEEAALNVFFRSDQYPFVLRGIPAMWWFTGFHPDYHQVTDTVEKIDYPKMVKILELAFHTAEDFGNMSKPPLFVPVARPELRNP